MRTDWMAEAACAGSELDFYDFYKRNEPGEQGEALDDAKFLPLVAVCVSCPVIVECATYAMRPDAPETFGVWAGTTPKQRHALRRAHDPIAAVVAQADVNATTQLDLGVA